MSRRLLSYCAPLAICLSSSVGLAQLPAGEDLGIYDSAVQALANGAHTEALQKLELLADRGVIHPDISFDRAVAYAFRARSPQARPGDFGRAAFALSETLTLRPTDVEAAELLTRVDHELSKARSRHGNPSLLARPRLTRAVVGLLPENAWAVGALMGSLTATVGLILRAESSRPRRKLAGGVAAWLGAALLVVTGLGLGYAVHARHTTRQGVVVSTDARLLDVTGAPLVVAHQPGQDLSIPEGARVAVTGRTERLLQVEWGSLEAYVSPGELQLLPERK